MSAATVLLLPRFSEADVPNASRRAVQIAAFNDTIVSLAFAFALGTLIGAEQQYRQRTAGLSTNALVALGAAVFVHLGITLNGNAGAVQAVAYVASGVFSLVQAS